MTLVAESLVSPAEESLASPAEESSVSPAVESLVSLVGNWVDWVEVIVVREKRGSILDFQNLHQTQVLRGRQIGAFRQR